MTDIHFDDLKHDKQRELLETFGLTNPAQANWEVIPLTFVAHPVDNEGDDGAPKPAPDDPNGFTSP
jgi:hypothetical protein